MNEDVARDWEDRRAVGWSPEVAVMAAEKRFEWIMKILSRDGDGPFGIVEDYVWKKECQKCGAVHWHMLLWCKPGTVAYLAWSSGCWSIPLSSGITTSSVAQ